MTNTANTTRILATSFALSLTFSGSSQAAWIVDPLLQLTTGYSDNPQLASVDEDKGGIGTATVRASLRNQTENTNVVATLGVNYRAFTGVDDLENRTTEYFRFRAAQKNERLGYRINALARRDDLLRRVDEFDLDDPLAGDSTGASDPNPSLSDDFLSEDPIEGTIDDNVVREQIERIRFEVEPTLNYRFNERTNAQLGYEYQGFRFDDEGEDVGLQDSDQHSIVAMLNRALTPRNNLSTRIRVSRFEPDGANFEADTYQASLLFNRQISESFSLGFEVGGRRIESDFSEDNGVVLGLRSAWRGPRSRLNIGLGRSVMPNPYGDVVEVDQVTARYALKLSERLSFQLPLRAFRTESDIDNVNGIDRDRTIATVSPGIAWAATQNWSLGLNYTYRYADRNNEPDAATANEVFMSITYSPIRPF